MKTHQRVNDTMAVTCTHSAIIEWETILDSVTVEPDDCHDAPWDNCEGYEHRLVPVDGPDEDSYKAFRHNGQWVAVDLEYDTELFNWYRERGAGKQVAEQLTRRSMWKRIERLIDWHKNGWEWWCVRGEMHGCYASVGGIDDYDYAKEVVVEIAHELAYKLEGLGYSIKGKPEPVKLSWQVWQSQVNLFNWN